MIQISLKRILLVSHELTYSGAPRSLLNMSVILQSMGCEINVWSRRDGDFKREFIKKGFFVKIVPPCSGEWVNGIKKFDLVIFNTVFNADLCAQVQKFVRSILYIREAENIPQIIKDCGVRDDDIRRVKEIICVSEYARQFIVQRYHLEHIHVIHNYVGDEYRYRPNIVRKGIRHYLMSGTIEYRKGYDLAIQAFLNMPAELHNLTRLHIVGRIPEWSRSYWEGLIPEKSSRIIYHGEIQDEAERIRLYKNMNVFVVASRDEACSLVALEGAMLGKALILSENVGAKYLDIRRKYIYPTEDVGMLTRKMCQLTSRKALLHEGRIMRRRYLETSTEKIYRKALHSYFCQ